MEKTKKWLFFSYECKKIYMLDEKKFAVFQ